MSGELDGLAATIDSALSSKSEHIVQHPAELKVLAQLSESELRDFAYNRGWNVITRVGSCGIKFYNDASTQQPAEL